MKKNIWILSFLLILLTFVFVYPSFNQLSIYRITEYSRYYDVENCNKIGLQIENNQFLSDLDAREYFENIDRIANENNVVVSLTDIVRDESGSELINFYLTSNDKYISKALVLEKGYADELSSGVTYSSLSDDPRHKIALIFSDTVLKVTSILNCNVKASFFNLVSIDGDSETNFTNFISDLTQIYPELITVRQINPLINDQLSDLHYIDNQFDDLEIKFAIVLILTLVLGAKIFSVQKKISLYKIEGYSNIQIYWMIFLNYFLKGISAVFLLTLIVHFIKYGSNSETFTSLILLYSIQFIQLCVMCLVVSLIFFLIIKAIPITSSNKGKNELNEVQWVAYVVKVAVVFFMIPIMISSISYVHDFVMMNYRHDKTAKSLVNYYVFNTQGSSNYALDIGSKNYVSLHDDFVWNNGLFDQAKALYIEDYASFDPNHKDEYYAVDKSYLKQIGLLDDSANFDDIYIFIKEGIKVDVEEFKEKMLNTVRDPLPIHVITHNLNLQSYVTTDLLLSDEIQDLPLVYLPEEKIFEGQLNYKILYYDGTLSEVQEYVDNMFRSHGYSPFFNMLPLKSAYEQTFQAYNSRNINYMVQFIILLVAYILSNQFLLEVDIDNNNKRYFLSMTEGINPYTTSTYFLKFASASMIALLLCVISRRIPIDSSLVVISGFLILAELILYLIYLVACNRIRI